jgi:hypothetical protein
MQEHGWRVGRLTEIAPGLDTGVVGLSDVAPQPPYRASYCAPYCSLSLTSPAHPQVCLLGLNINKGQEIQLRLRTSDLLGVRPYWLIKKTLLHELTHCVHSSAPAPRPRRLRAARRAPRQRLASARSLQKPRRAVLFFGMAEGPALSPTLLPPPYTPSPSLGREHDAKFWALCSQLMRDADAGDWTKSRSASPLPSLSTVPLLLAAR